MATKKKEVDHMAKVKKTGPTKKEVEGQINNINMAIGNLYMEGNKLNQFMIGLENLVMYLAEHIEKGDSFREFIAEKVEEQKKKAEEERLKQAKADLPKEESK